MEKDNVIIFNKNFKQTITDHEDFTNIINDYAKELEAKVHKVFTRLWNEDEWEDSKMNDLALNGNMPFEIFNYQNLGKVRVQVDNQGNPWFCLVDVCEILGLGTNDINKVLKRVDIPYQNTILVWVQTGVRQDGTPAMRETAMNFVSEAGLYQAIGRSRKPEAQVFMNWVFGEVLPMIRKTGTYFTTETWERITSSPGELAKVLNMYQAEIDKMKPGYERWNEWISSDRVYNVRQASHILGIKGMGLKNLFKYFRENGFVSKENIAFREYQDQGLFRVKEIDTITKNGYRYHRFQTFLTPKGIDYFRTRLLNEGYKDLDFYGEPEGMVSNYVIA